MKSLRACALLLLTLSGAACADSEVALDSVEITVVDAATGEPVAGAVVAIAWPVYEKAGSNLHEGDWYQQSGDLFLGETVTARDGTASFAATKVAVPPGGSLLRHDSPHLLVYREGYQPLQLFDEPRTDYYKGVMDMPDAIETSFHGSVARLERAPAEGLSEHNIQVALGFLQGFFDMRSNCRWTHFPELVERLKATSQTHELLAKRMHWILADRDCIKVPVMTWQEREGALELNIDADALYAGRAFASPPAPGTGEVMIVATGENAAGIMFFTRTGSDEQLHLRFNGEPATLGPIAVSAGERFELSYINMATMPVRTGTVELHAVPAPVMEKQQPDRKQQDDEQQQP